MTNKVQTIAAQAAQLERQERVTIIEKLLASLESEPPEDAAKVAELWNNEVRRRSTELRSGNVTPIPWDQVKASGEKLFDAD